MDNALERTAAPTARRRDESREQGQVPRSLDLTAAATLLTGTLLLVPLSMHLLRRCWALVERALTTSEADPLHELAIGFDSAVSMLAPFAIGLPLLAILVGAVQTGFLFTVHPLAPDLSRLSPARGLRRIVSFRSSAAVAMSLAKVAVVLTVASLMVYADMPKLIGLAEVEWTSILPAIAGLVWSLAWKLAAILLLLGALDYALQRYHHERDLHMTPTQMRQELKRTEGDPLLRLRRLTIARQIAAQRSHGDVAHADVVIAQRGAFAVALRYDAALEAPKLIAKAAGAVAQHLCDSAAKHGVPVVERHELAKTLCRRVAVGQQTPPRLYEQVAEVLAYVYRLSGRKIA